MAWRPSNRVVVVLLTAWMAVWVASRAVWGSEQKKLPKPETIDLVTKDGVELKATYYGQREGRKAVPVILLHDYKSNRNAFADLAQSLQQRGNAVIVPDLRGHGESTRMLLPGGQGERTVEAANLRRVDFVAMVPFDLEAVRRFLVTKNDAQEVNLNQLSLVGAGMGATVALNWAARDWTAPPLAVGKQGQDVKVIVLVSPVASFKGIPVQDALRVLADRRVGNLISLMIIVGRDDPKAMRDAQRIHKRFERWHPAPGHGETIAQQTLRLESGKTSLQGMKLLSAGGKTVQLLIADFIQWRAADQDFPWSKRRLAGE
jgi:pimeloyl-ACP methyl ester carboxylesterase